MVDDVLIVDLSEIDDHFICCYCRRRCIGDLWSRDHILPKNWGGSDSPDNLRISCRPCNMMMQQAAECPAILACARAVTEHSETGSTRDRFTRRMRKILSEWKPWQYVIFAAPNTPIAADMQAYQRVSSAETNKPKLT